MFNSGVTPMGSGCANPRAPELRGHPKGAPSAWVPIKIPWNSIQRQKMCPFKLQDFRNWWNQTYSGAPRTKSVFCNGSGAHRTKSILMVPPPQGLEHYRDFYRLHRAFNYAPRSSNKFSPKNHGLLHPRLDFFKPSCYSAFFFQMLNSYF